MASCPVPSIPTRHTTTASTLRRRTAATDTAPVPEDSSPSDLTRTIQQQQHPDRNIKAVACYFCSDTQKTTKKEISGSLITPKFNLNNLNPVASLFFLKKKLLYTPSLSTKANVFSRFFVRVTKTPFKKKKRI